jgi:hypothetical protein
MLKNLTAAACVLALRCLNRVISLGRENQSFPSNEKSAHCLAGDDNLFHAQDEHGERDLHNLQILTVGPPPLVR